MIDNEVSFTSLCYITVDYEGRIWLNRLADVEDDILHTPFKSERTDNYFENRDRLYRNDGPTALGTVGIWEWTAIPNRDNPAIDYVQSYYVKDYSPVRVVVLMAKSLDEVIEQLQNGTARTQAYFCDTLFCYEPKWGQFAGVLCRANEFNISDRCAKLSETVYSLPSYTISSGDIYNWDDRNLRFLKTLQVGEPSGYVSIGNTDEVIRTLILERTTWPLFKECIGATKAEWKHCKLLLEKICGESLYDAIVQKLNCTLDQAKQTVDDFVNRADALVKVGDIDVNVLAEIAKNHDELRELCEKAVSVEWHNSHAAEIAKAEAEVSEMEETISIAKKQHSELLAEIATKQGELDRLLAEIAQYESIGKETLVAVRQKIADAQKDMAGFIADISVFLPQSNATLPYGNPPASWQYSSTSGQYSDEDIELAESWRNEYDAIYQNLSCALGIEPDFCSMLTAFLYATHINNVPTLIAGPGGQDIAEVLSVSMYANGAGQLTLGDECDLSIVERISEADDSIVSVQNMFGKGWTDALPQKFTRLKKQIIWTHPYVEDMFRGDPRKPWIDISSEKITQRHLGMVALQTYLREKSNSLDAIPAIEFLDEHLQPFSRFLEIFEISKDDILVPVGSKGALGSYKDELEKSLSALKQKRDDHPELFETDDSSDSGKKSLLDALYEEGVIPTYSFPKNVVSTYISDVSGKVKYQVERGLDVAIGEYAPGRAIVVDKTTYQIGGLYYPGGERSERTAASPAKAFIQDASYRKSIRTCSQCGWFGLEEDNPDTCPFCGNKALTNMLPMLRPWGFAPRNATSIETAQLNEEYSATQQPLYSTLPDADDVTAVNGCANIRMAVRPNQRIIMLNNGVSGKGFTICCDCGAAMPGDDPAVLKDVLRPYRSKFIKTRCKHSDTINVNLGYDFVTDMLVLEFALDRQQIDTNPTRNSWLNRAGQSLAEGLRLAACQELDIEFTELVTGFRVRQNRNGDFVDIYLYDSLSSGAGYAVSIESSIRQLLTKTRELLEGCTCDSACHSCLKHYRNQYIHSVLDRKAALDLLNWGETGARVSAVPYEKQQYLLKSLEQILQISGIHIDVNHESVWAEGRYSKKKVVVYPAMWTKPIEENTIFVSDAHLKYAKPYALKTILDSL